MDISYFITGSIFPDGKNFSRVVSRFLSEYRLSLSPFISCLNLDIMTSSGSFGITRISAFRFIFLKIQAYGKIINIYAFYHCPDHFTVSIRKLKSCRRNSFCSAEYITSSCLLFPLPIINLILNLQYGAGIKLLFLSLIDISFFHFF